MGRMVANLMEGTSRIGMTQSKMVGSWIHLIGEAVATCFILALVQTGMMVIIVIIITGGSRGILSI